MELQLPARQCRRCGTALARDNTDRLCAGCRHQARDALLEPPAVPDDFWRVEPIHEALARWHMGHVIRAYRNHPWHGRVLSQEMVANWLNLTQAQLSRIEKGPPPDELSKLIHWARTFGIPAELLWFKLPESADKDDKQTGLVTAEAVLPVSGFGSSELAGDILVFVRVQLDDGGEAVVPIDRRTLLQRGVAAATGIAADSVMQTPALPAPESQATESQLLTLSPAQQREVLTHLREQWHLLVKTDNMLGPRFALGAVREQIRIIEALLRAARDQVRREALQLGAQYAESLAWLHEDAGDLVQARYWTGRAMEWAHQADDHLMLAWTLFRRSQQASAEHDAAEVIGLAQAAGREAQRLPTPMQAAILVQEAHGHALDGAEIACHELLDRAHDRATSVRDDGDARSGHGSFCTPAYVEMQRGRCWLCLQEPARATATYKAALPELPTVYHRDRGMALSGLAATYAATNEPEQAATTASQALTIARASGSTRIVDMVLSIRQTLRPHRKLASVAAFLDSVTETRAV